METINTIGFLLHHLGFLLARSSEQALQDQLGIGFSQFKILRVLQCNPQVQQKQIADALGQTQASISRQIKIMHDDGLLKTTLQPDNRRRHLTTLTAKGQNLNQEAVVILNQYHQPMFDQLTNQETQQLTDILQKLHGYACAAGETLCKRQSK